MEAAATRRNLMSENIDYDKLSEIKSSPRKSAFIEENPTFCIRPFFLFGTCRYPSSKNSANLAVDAFFKKDCPSLCPFDRTHNRRIIFAQNPPKQFTSSNSREKYKFRNSFRVIRSRRSFRF